MIAVLLPPPLGRPSRLPGLPGALPALGVDPVLPAAGADDRAPYAARYVAQASLEVNRLVGTGEPVALVAEGGAGPLVGAVGAAQRAAHRPVFGYVLVDSLLPRPGSPTRADLERDQGAEGEAADEEKGPSGYRSEPLPMVADWPDAPCGYLLTGPARAHAARLARMRGWTVREAAPEEAPRVLAALLADLRG
ncbi:hypothetical protein [Nocardiopsis sp. CNT312]|uniref:hypothetical protein n=1 Tax=Nocardiopsis sp. CNT312 TaxID=1137268 RepID=UPI00048CDDFD|nr:hypothetical protein [Nocardiopsis sp. CNT312]